VRPIAGRLAPKLCASAQDLESVGLLALLGAAAEFDAARSASFKAFAIFRIRAAMIDSVKGRPYREAHHAQLSDAAADAGALPDELASRRILAERLAAAIARLPEDERRVIEMRFYEGLGARTAADRLRISPAGQGRLRRGAIDRLRSILFDGGWAGEGRDDGR